MRVTITYVKLWHDDFVGWPCFERNPTRKGDIRKWVSDIRDNRWKLTYQLKPLGIQESGDDTVVVHYAAEYVYDYGDGTRSGVGLWRKFTHTWMKSDGRWHIIGASTAQHFLSKVMPARDATVSGHRLCFGLVFPGTASRNEPVPIRIDEPEAIYACSAD